MTQADLSREGYIELVIRELADCPDLGCDEAVMRHLHELRLPISPIGASAFDAILDEIRASKRNAVGVM